MNVFAISPEVATVIHTNAWAELTRHAQTIGQLCSLISEQDTLCDTAIALGHAIRAQADCLHDLAAYNDDPEAGAAVEQLADDWASALSKAGDIRELVELLREKAIGNPAAFALASSIELLAERISGTAIDNTP